METWKRLTTTTLVSLLLASAALATENGGGAYPNGAEGLMTGALPPPGDYFVNYALYYTADTFKNDAGGTLMLPDGSRAPFDLEIAGTVLRYIHVTDKTLWGGSWAQHIFVPLLYVDVKTPAGSDSKFGLGDLIVDPIILGWHKPPFHWAAGIDVYVPVGAYDEDEIANVGRNYWTIEPVLALTYLDENGVEASAKFMYDFNFENDDTDYESGEEFHFDYVVAKHLGAWTVGVGGFYYEQVEDDEGTIGMDPSGGNKGKQFAWGPQVGYQHKGLTFSLKYQDETETENKPEGERLWFTIIGAL